MEDLSEEDLLAQIEAEERIADADAARVSHGDDDAQDDQYRREIVYRVSLDGMKIQLEDVEFQPRAERIRVRGGYGVKLTVTAVSSLSQTLLNPKSGPMAFGGSVYRESQEKFGDRREGDAELRLVPGKPATFSRVWPSAEQRPLEPGERLELQIGLWGLGMDAESRRPVKKFFVVRLKAGENELPSIEPASM